MVKREVEDLSGQKFGAWEVIRFDSKDKYNHAKFLCRCGCGTEKVIHAATLKSGGTKSCGCIKNALLSKKMTEDLIGQRFGRLVVESFSRRGKNGTYWNSRCDCGNEKDIRASELKQGDTRSCGCLRKEVIAKRNTTHGLYRHPLYVTWKDMCSRCNDSNATGYERYGGRGIKVCDRWSGTGGFPNFLEDMGERPEGTSLDRIDNNGNYCKENCRWFTPKGQHRNKRNNKLLTLNGEIKTLAEWSEELGISSDTITTRLTRLGWDEEKALTTPVNDLYSNTGVKSKRKRGEKKKRKV